MIRRLTSVAVGAAALAGAGVAAVPQHAASIAVLAVAAVAAVAATFVVVLAAPLVVARPEPWPTAAAGRAVPPLDPQGLREARRQVRIRLAEGADPATLLQQLEPHGGSR